MSLPAVADFRDTGRADLVRKDLVVSFKDNEIAVRLLEPPDIVLPDTAHLVTTLNLAEPVLLLLSGHFFNYLPFKVMFSKISSHP